MSMYHVNIGAFLDDPEGPAIVKATARRLAEGPFSLGSWLADLSMLDLEAIGRWHDVLREKQQVSQEGHAIMQLIALLSIAEGLELCDDGGEQQISTDLTRRFSALGAMLALEKLERLGIIEFYRSNASLQLDDGDSSALAKIKE